MSLSSGPAPLGPNDPDPCEYGWRGAMRAAAGLTVTTPYSAVFWAMCLAAVGVLGFANAGVTGALVGTLGGTALAYGILTVWLMSRLGQRHHWQQEISRYTGGGGGRTHSLLSLKSCHLHMVKEIVCSVKAPGGQIATHPWRALIGSPGIIRKGDGPTLSYPGDFDPKVWPTPGAYEVTWTMTPQGGGKVVTIFEATWTVEDGLPKTPTTPQGPGNSR